MGIGLMTKTYQKYQKDKHPWVVPGGDEFYDHSFAWKAVNYIVQGYHKLQDEIFSVTSLDDYQKKIEMYQDHLNLVKLVYHKIVGNALNVKIYDDTQEITRNQILFFTSLLTDVTNGLRNDISYMHQRINEINESERNRINMENSIKSLVQGDKSLNIAIEDLQYSKSSLAISMIVGAIGMAIALIPIYIALL